MKLPRNYNRSLSSEPFSYDKVENAYFGLKRGIITNTYNLAGRLGLFYDVKLLDTGVVVKGVKATVSNGGFNGEGNYFSYDIDTPVLIAGTNGRLGQGDAYIISTFTTEGDYNEFYKEGKLQDYGETKNGQLFNQPLGHPNKIAQEDAHIEVFNIKNLDSAYDSPEFYSNGAERNEARARPGIIKLDNRDGNSVHYTFDNNIKYADGNLLFITGGNKETLADRFLSIAIRHINKARFAAGKLKIAEEDLKNQVEAKPEATDTSKETQNTTNTPAKPTEQTAETATPVSNTSNIQVAASPEGEVQPTTAEGNTQLKNNEEPEFITLFRRTTNLANFVLDTQTVAQQELILASIYCEAAKNAVALNTGRLAAVGAMNTAFPGNLQPTVSNDTNTIPTIDGGFNPTQTTAPVAANNFGERTIPGAVNNEGTSTIPPMIIVLHETVSDLEGALSVMNDSAREVSYHVIIDRQGEVINLTPSTKRAFGAGTPSKFRGQFYGTPGKPSVNAFAYQISFESPPDGRGNGPTHSGYTEAQYKSLAWVISRTGISEDRITTHKAVATEAGRSDRQDPRSFDWAKYRAYRNQFTTQAVINFGV